MASAEVLGVPKVDAMKTKKNPELTVRAYKYRVYLTDPQEERLASLEARLRRGWNRGVAILRLGKWSCTHGRYGDVVAKYGEAIAGAKFTGALAAKINERCAEQGISKKAAWKAFVSERVAALATVPTSKKHGKPLRSVFRRKTPAWLAAEALSRSRSRLWPDSLPSASWHMMVAKFRDCVEAWVKNPKECGEPTRKKRSSNVAVGAPLPRGIRIWDAGGKTWVDLSMLAGPAFGRCELVQHRPLPDGATPKNVRLSGRAGVRFISVELEAREELFRRPGVATGHAAGVDPGMKAALTVVRDDSASYGWDNKQTFTPTDGLPRAERAQARAARLQRKLDRQQRENNPACFDENGVWIKGARLYNITKGMLRTQLALAKIAARTADYRSQFYHRVANQLLGENDVVCVGNFRPTTLAKKNKKGAAPLPKGLAAARRARNRKSYQHAISSFVAMLKDKARRTAGGKQVVNVDEKNTTKTCPRCGTENNFGLDTREWVCSNCQTRHDRDGAAAWNILQRGMNTLGSGDARRSLVGFAD